MSGLAGAVAESSRASMAYGLKCHKDAVWTLGRLSVLYNKFVEIWVADFRGRGAAFLSAMQRIRRKKRRSMTRKDAAIILTELFVQNT